MLWSGGLNYFQELGVLWWPRKRGFRNEAAWWDSYRGYHHIQPFTRDRFRCLFSSSIAYFLFFFPLFISFLAGHFIGLISVDIPFFSSQHHHQAALSTYRISSRMRNIYHGIRIAPGDVPKRYYLLWYSRLATKWMDEDKVSPVEKDFSLETWMFFLSMYLSAAMTLQECAI